MLLKAELCAKTLRLMCVTFRFVFRILVFAVAGFRSVALEERLQRLFILFYICFRTNATVNFSIT